MKIYDIDIIDAARTNDVVRMKQLLADGENPNFFEDSFGITPLHFAILHRSMEVIPLLIAAGADIHAKAATRESLIELANELEHREIFEFLSQLSAATI